MERKQKKRKVQRPPRRSLFGNCPDEMVLTILSYCEIKDIQSTRVWQSKIVRHWTDTTSKLKAARNDNLDNIKWIYGYIEDIEFYGEDSVINCTGNNYLINMNKKNKALQFHISICCRKWEH